MNVDWLGLGLDLIIIGLLAGTIVTAFALNKRIMMIRQGREELEILVRGFAEATQRAEAGVKAMRQTASETGEQLLKQVDRARALRDELQIMIETADSLCSRLENIGTRVAPPASRAAGGAAPAASAGQAAAAVSPAVMPSTAPSSTTRTGAVAAKPGAEGGDMRPAAPVVDTLSRAERELLQVIEKLR